MKVGVIGGGQLGQMLRQASHPLDIAVDCYVGDPLDSMAIKSWSSGIDVVTYESENVAASTLDSLASGVVLRPGRGALQASQHRLEEKSLFDSLSIPLAPYRGCSTETELRDAVDELGAPVVVKTVTGGYDGKGQVVVDRPDHCHAAADLLAHGAVVVEKRIAFDFEVSMVAVRDSAGGMRFYAPVINHHSGGVLRVSRPVNDAPAELVAKATEHVAKIAERLDYVGVLALEMFRAGGELLANEMAPRVHNSGHWTIEGAVTSQFDNHLRAVCGLPLGDTTTREMPAMINLIGNTGSREHMMRVDGAHLHLYGKEPRPGRKLGHVTITATSEEQLIERAGQVESVLGTHWGLPSAIK